MDDFNPYTPQELSRILPDYQLTFHQIERIEVTYKAEKEGEIYFAKILLPKNVGDRDLKLQFSNKVKTLSKLNHKGLLMLVESGEREGIPYMISEYFEGKSLFNAFNNSIPKEKDAAYIVSRVCEILSYLHSNKITHLGVKPSNIYINTKGKVKLLQLGQVRDDNADLEYSRVYATKGYTAPEVTENGGNVTPACDVFSCGSLLLELLTGKPPEDDLTGVDNENVCRVIEVARNIDASQRFSASKLESLLHDISLGKAVEAKVPTKLTKKRVCSIKPLALIAVFVLVGAIVSFFSLKDKAPAVVGTPTQAEYLGYTPVEPIKVDELEVFEETEGSTIKQKSQVYELRQYINKNFTDVAPAYSENSTVNVATNTEKDISLIVSREGKLNIEIEAQVDTKIREIEIYNASKLTASKVVNKKVLGGRVANFSILVPKFKEGSHWIKVVATNGIELTIRFTGAKTNQYINQYPSYPAQSKQLYSDKETHGNVEGAVEHIPLFRKRFPRLAALSDAAGIEMEVTADFDNAYYGCADNYYRSLKKINNNDRYKLVKLSADVQQEMVLDVTEFSQLFLIIDKNNSKDGVGCWKNPKFIMKDGSEHSILAKAITVIHGKNLKNAEGIKGNADMVALIKVPKDTVSFKSFCISASENKGDIKFICGNRVNPEHIFNNYLSQLVGYEKDDRASLKCQQKLIEAMIVLDYVYYNTALTKHVKKKLHKLNKIVSSVIADATFYRVSSHWGDMGSELAYSIIWPITRAGEKNYSNKHLVTLNNLFEKPAYKAALYNWLIYATDAPESVKDQYRVMLYNLYIDLGMYGSAIDVAHSNTKPLSAKMQKNVEALIIKLKGKNAKLVLEGYRKEYKKFITKLKQYENK